MIIDVLRIYYHARLFTWLSCEIAGTLSRQERLDRYRRVLLGRHARVFRGRRAAKPGNARRRKRVDLRQADRRTSVQLPTYPRAGLRRRNASDQAVASWQAADRRRQQPDQFHPRTTIFRAAGRIALHRLRLPEIRVRRPPLL